MKHTVETATTDKATHNSNYSIVAKIKHIEHEIITRYTRITKSTTLLKGRKGTKCDETLKTPKTHKKLFHSDNHKTIKSRNL